MAKNCRDGKNKFYKQLKLDKDMKKMMKVYKKLIKEMITETA